MSFNYFKLASHAEAYAKFRPNPPEEIAQCITNFLRRKIQDKNGKFGKAVDVGCGSGQSTQILQKYFEEVIGFDSSPHIIDEANKSNQFENISYKVSPAEKISMEENSVDLVTTCQAAHWFDLKEFYDNTKKLLKTNGVLAIYGYSLPQPQGEHGKELTQLIERYYKDVLKDYIHEQSPLVYLENYRNEKFNVVPFVENGLMTRKEPIITEITCSLRELTGYMQTWSGFQHYCQQTGDAKGEKILSAFQNDLVDILGPVSMEEPLNIRYNYFVLLGAKCG